MAITRAHLPITARLTGLLFVAALLDLTGFAAPSARADATEDAFLAAITAKGIHFQSPETALVAAHEVCDELGLGRSKQDVANEVMQNSNLSGYSAGYFVGASVRAFCPNFAG
jgi:hypothetical protein